MSRFNPLAGVSRADIRYDPYPHVVIENALPPDLFSELQATFPDDSFLGQVEDRKNKKIALNASEVIEANGIAPIWSEFVKYCSSNQFFQSVVALFGDELMRQYPFLAKELAGDLANVPTETRVLSDRKGKHRQDPIVLDCQITSDDTTEARVCRGPHVDAPTELYAGLIYFRSPEDESTGGDLHVLKSNDPKMRFPFRNTLRVDRSPAEIDGSDMEIVSTVPYVANTAVFFVNGPRAIHGVSERSATPIGRRHVNIIGETYSLRRGGLFTIQQANGEARGAKPSTFARVRSAFGL